jgi:RNA polymerase sigma-70 factor (ECF subfamily)
LLRDPCAAEDACQETLIAAWRHREDGDLGRTWLIHVAVNKCRDELRRRARRPSYICGLDDAEVEAILSHEPTPEAMTLNADYRRAVERSLLQLPWVQRVALVLGDMEGWSYREIASATGVSLGTVKSRIFRGRVRLRELLLGA